MIINALNMVAVEAISAVFGLSGMSVEIFFVVYVYICNAFWRALEINIIYYSDKISSCMLAPNQHGEIPLRVHNHDGGIA